jgi:hypothetical protein
MDRQWFTLTTPLARSNCARALVDSPDGTRVQFNGPKRSHEQNALLWSRLEAISNQVEWYGQHLTGEDWKDDFSASLRRARVVPGLDAGSFVPLGMRTSQMSKQEFSDLLELIAAFGAERGVVLPEDTPRAWRKEDAA